MTAVEFLLPYYGDPRRAAATVTSVLDQTSPDWRLLVVDDAYPDPAFGRWVVALADPRIRYERNPVNLGVNRNLARCLHLATAEHVVFPGCDDRLHPDYARIVPAALATRPRAVLAQPRVRVIDGDGTPRRGLPDLVKSALAPSLPPGGRSLAGPALVRSLLHGDWMYFPAIAWRRDVLAAYGFRPGLETALDLEVLLRLAADGHPFLLLDQVLFDYRRHRASASSVSARNSARFAEEKAIHRTAAVRARLDGDRRTELAARLRATSRLHAALVAGRNRR